VTASLAAGPGNSSNYLKRPIALSSDYLRAEGSAFLDWSGKRVKLTAMLFGEASLYGTDETVSDEYLVFAQVDASVPLQSVTWGLLAEGFYADQIYDASLDPTSVPVGTRLRQVRPRAAAYLDWYPGKRDRLRLEPSLLRADYDVDSEDHWEPAAAVEWERLWRKGLISEARIEVARQDYDGQVARDSRGIALPGAIPLEVDRLSLEQRINWSPPDWKWLQAQLGGGMAWDDDRDGEYESLRQAWASASVRTAFKWGHLRLVGRWSEFRYDDRQVSFTDPTPQLQIQRALRVELKKRLPWDLALYLRAGWTEFTSRDADESYSERRTEGLLEWSY
jgi:hypothetical protein